MTSEEAIAADVVLPAIPSVAVQECARIQPDWTGKIVVDAAKLADAGASGS